VETFDGDSADRVRDVSRKKRRPERAYLIRLR
jgi:hypothetical protein